MADKGRTENVGETLIDGDEKKDFKGSKIEGKKEIPPGPPFRKGGGETVTGDQVVASMRKRGVKI